MKPSGYVDIFTVDRVSGWAWNPAEPDQPVNVVIADGAETVLTVRADMFRRDLAQSGIGNGYHGFSIGGLHHLVPWSRRNLAVQRESDRAELNGSPGALIATGGPHLLLSPGNREWSIAFGGGAYRLGGSDPGSMLAACLPLSIVDPADDLLPLRGDASLTEDEDGMGLVLRRDDLAQNLRLSLKPNLGALPHLRWCKGGPVADCWTRPTMILEAENLLGLQLSCFLPAVPGLPAKRLSVAVPGIPVRHFELARGRTTRVGFRVSRRERHRMLLSTDPEPDPGRALGFVLHRLDVLERAPDEDPA